MLQSHQSLIANIEGKAYAATKHSRDVRNDLTTNVDEADLRVWLHCVKSSGVRKLLYSPDTDIYHIGLTIVGELQECEVIVQLRKGTNDRDKYVHMNNMLTALATDPDLSEIHAEARPQVIQSIYVATGCDYTSFFHGLGKVTFLATFFQHAAFISGRNSPPGTMGETGDSDSKFSFLRLIGCAYYKQHVSAFCSQTPEALFFSVTNATSTHDHHAKWLAKIRILKNPSQTSTSFLAAANAEQGALRESVPAKRKKEIVVPAVHVTSARMVHNFKSKPARMKVIL